MYNIKFFFSRFSVVFLASFFLIFSASALAQNPASVSAHSTHVKSTANDQSSVNINTADPEMIANAHIKGIGKKRAEAIVAYRTQHGPFKTVDDLKNIKGLSGKIIDQNKERLKLN